MKYLFFDIECSNNFNKKPKMCEFGYVITDENFKVIRKGDIAMSPGKKSRGNRFDEGVYKRDPKFQWAYEYDYYFNCPEFPKYYDQIKQLFEDKDTIVFGFSIDNDINYLNATLTRYNYDLINYDAYDIQLFIGKYLKEHKTIGLENAFKKMCSINEYIKLQAHLPRDDAYMTMRVFEEMCKCMNKFSLDVIDEFKSFKINSIEFNEKYLRNLENSKAKEEARIFINEFYDKYELLIENPEYNGKRINISRHLHKNLDLLKDLVCFIEEKEFIGCRIFEKSDYIIALDKEDYERIEQILKENLYETKVLLFEDFLKEIA